MKKQILGLAMALSAFTMHAQVLNSSFENLNQSGSIKNWGSLMLISIVLDTSGNVIDSLVLDSALYFSTSDAHSGIRAMEMRNAYMSASNYQITGQASLTVNDSDYAFFGAPVPALNRPTDLTFYYKFYPAISDTAFAWMAVYDEFGSQIGEATYEITGTVPNYSLAVAPVIYSTQDSAAFIAIGFKTAKPGSAANFGTRFLVDDVDLLVNGIDNVPRAENFISCFPNPAEDFLNLNLNKIYAAEKINIQVTDVCGKSIAVMPYSVYENTIKADVSSLLPGVYFITVSAGPDRYSARFVK